MDQIDKVLKGWNIQSLQSTLEQMKAENKPCNLFDMESGLNIKLTITELSQYIEYRIHGKSGI